MSNIRSAVAALRIQIKKPRPFTERGLPIDRRMHYLLPRLDALSGLIFAFFAVTAAETWDARLQFPVFHFKVGSGQAVQYQPVENSEERLQPLHCSTI